MSHRPFSSSGSLRALSHAALASLLLVQASLTQGCSKWVHQPLAQEELDSTASDRIRITLLTGEQLILIDPSFDAEHMSGYRPVRVKRHHLTRFVRGERVVIARNQIATCEKWTRDEGRTLLAGVAFVSVAVLGVALAAVSHSFQGWR